MADIQPIFSNSEELREWLLDVHEKYYIELKKAQELPNAFWETYSSFCNTSGGVIVLGVVEGYPQNDIQGVGNVAKTLTSLWDQISNRTKVSFRNINNEDVTEYKLDANTTIILVSVKEAPEGMKPVYINDKLENTWIRTGEGDRKATKEEIAAFMRNAQPSQDDLVLDNFDMNDLDLDTVLAFKERVNKRYPKQKYLEMTNEEFITEIGAGIIDRVSGKFKLKRGTLLFLGKVNAIREIYPHYHVDYFNRRGNNPRWSDRVTDDEPSEYQMNLYNFYFIVYGKLKILLKESFELDRYQLRIPFSDFDETIRECLVNCLAHADYEQGYPSIKIEVFDGWFNFVNPGKMLISKTQFVMGGNSRPRNEIIMKQFRLLGASERQGFGGPLIYKTAISNDFRRPEIITDIEHTELKIWNIDLVDSYPDLSNDEKIVLRYIIKNGADKSLRELAPVLGITEYRVRKAVTSLVEERHIIKREGNGKSTKYCLEMGSIEMLTCLQMALEVLKSCI
ncbi:MAG: putative DNA binding domain-containing protein [Ruminococcus sp.]|nr:putative DNA binding domain-containing protein [Ruminococcus sp.]